MVAKGSCAGADTITSMRRSLPAAVRNTPNRWSSLGWGMVGEVER